MYTLIQDSLVWIHAVVSPMHVNVRFRHQSRSEQKIKTNTKSSTIVLRSRAYRRAYENESFEVGTAIVCAQMTVAVLSKNHNDSHKKNILK